MLGLGRIYPVCWSGLLTIWDRFGGAFDGATVQFTEAFESGLIANGFVNKAKNEGVFIRDCQHRKNVLNKKKRKEKNGGML